MTLVSSGPGVQFMSCYLSRLSKHGHLGKNWEGTGGLGVCFKPSAPGKGTCGDNGKIPPWGLFLPRGMGVFSGGWGFLGALLQLLSSQTVSAGGNMSFFHHCVKQPDILKWSACCQTTAITQTAPGAGWCPRIHAVCGSVCCMVLALANTGNQMNSLAIQAWGKKGLGKMGQKVISLELFR